MTWPLFKPSLGMGIKKTGIEPVYLCPKEDLNLHDREVTRT